LKAEILAAHDRDVVRGRLGVLAGLAGFVLACLAALAGYIRMDEATKGYYTNPLRLVAAAGVGAAGVVIYQTADLMARPVVPCRGRVGPGPDAHTDPGRPGQQRGFTRVAGVSSSRPRPSHE
jgi:hypothetical protein